MFYSTQIKAVTSSGVVDVQGRNLSFIGYLPVKAGDTVFTDGRFIFGNAPPKGSPTIFSEQSGIPVLGDEDLRGYFTKNGKFKKCNIAGNDWLVNNEKIYTHDDGEENIIDAEIAEDGEIYTVEKKVTQITENDSSSDVLFWYYYSSYYHPYQRQDYYSMLNFERYTRGTDTYQINYQTWWIINPLNNPDYFKDTTPTINQATWVSAQFTEHEIIEKYGDGISRDCDIIIKKNGEEFETLKLSKIVEFAETAAFEYVNVTVPNYTTKNYIKSAANLLNFKISPDRKWELLFEIEIGAEHDYPRPEANHYYSEAVKVREWLGYSTAASHSYFIFKVDSYGNTEKIVEQSSFMPLYLIDNINTSAITIPFKRESGVTHYYGARPPIVPTATFPYDNCLQTGVWWDGGTGEGEETWGTYTVWDSHYWAFAPDYANGTEEIADDFTFPVQDDYQARIINSGDIGNWRLDGIYYGNKKIFDIASSGTDAHKWNMSLDSLKSGKFLFGIHDGALYKIDSNGNATQVGGGLKNFRLRELKKISKAKK